MRPILLAQSIEQVAGCQNPAVLDVSTTNVEQLHQLPLPLYFQINNSLAYVDWDSSALL